MIWLKWTAAGLVGATLLLAIVAVFALRRSLPDYTANLSVTGISAPVRIARTGNAVPHIFGQTDPDVFFGLGYAHAQDRIWQMELMRRTAQGRLSELLGPKTLHTDELLRRLDLYTAAQSSFAVQDDFAKAALTAYAAGVNAFLATSDGWGQRAPEFLLFPDKVAPWTPTDSLALLKLLALQLASHTDREVLRARISRAVPPERLRDILPDDPQAGVGALASYAALFPGLPDDSGTMQAALPGLMTELGADLSSNAWAVGPARSATGASLMANDPHLNFAAPGVWYLTALNLEGGAAIGGTIPGIPLILSGRSADLGWGLTTANMDDQDVYVERLNPANPNEVLTPTGFQPMRARHETIPVRGAAPVAIDLQWTDNGPVFPGTFYNFATITPPGSVISVARTLFDPADTSMSAAMRLMRAKSVDAALVAVQDFVTPAQNLTVVDHDHIALQTIGRMPARDPAHHTQGRMPSEGWLAVNRWHGYLPYSDNPRFVDPVSGAVGNTNNKTVDRPFPLHVSLDWGDTQRILRLQDLLASRPTFDKAAFMAMQADAVSNSARTLVPLVTKALQPTDPRASEAVALLIAWDGTMDAARAEPLIYAAWMRALQTRLIRPALGPIAQALPLPNTVFLQRVFTDTEGAAAWCAPQTCAEVAAAALTDALAEVAGPRDLKSLRWGDLHQALHDNQVLGALPLIGPWVNLHNPASGGDDTLLRGLTKGDGDTPYADIHGAGYRGIYDMANPDASVFVAATGQSGHPLSSHYRDLNGLWRQGGYLPMTLDPQEVAATTVTTLTLTPAR